MEEMRAPSLPSKSFSVAQVDMVREFRVGVVDAVYSMYRDGIQGPAAVYIPLPSRASVFSAEQAVLTVTGATATKTKRQMRADSKRHLDGTP
jgi:hypothetical protein